MEQVAQFLEFTVTADKQTAVLFIRGNGNDVQQAVMAYYDNPDPSRFKNQQTQVGWDESAFSTDRDGAVVQGPVNQCTPDVSNRRRKLTRKKAFTVDSAAPSRPPSRTQGAMNQQSQMPPSYGKSEMSLSDAVWAAFNKPKATATDEVWDMTRKDEYEGENEAIQRSLEDHSGREYSMGQVIVPDPEATFRARLPGAPAFLRQMTAQDFLPALVSVLHSIIPCRNALLSSQVAVDDYGHNPNWWSGDDIQTSTVSYQADENAPPETPPPASRPFEIELQRLMALLDGTERAYGSVDSLARLPFVRSGSGSDQIVNGFMEAWDKSHKGQELFQNIVSCVSANSSERNTVRVFRIPRTSLSSSQTVSLHEAIDNTLWEKQPDGHFEMDNFVESLAPIVAIDIEEHNAKQLEVPQNIFLDRYMSENKPTIVEANEHNKIHLERIKRIQSMLDKIQNASCPDSKNGGRKAVQTSALFNTTINYFESRQGAEDSSDGVKDGSVLHQLREISKRIDERVKELNEEKEKTQAALKTFSSILTDTNDTTRQPSVSYTLRGMARWSFRDLTTYLKHPDPGAPGGNDRWWKLCYESSHGTARVSTETIDRNEVLDAAGKGIDSTFLIYANSKLLEPTDPVPLSEPLQKFVAADNAAFQAERESAHNVPQPSQSIVWADHRGARPRRSSGSSTRVQYDSEDGDTDRSMPDLQFLGSKPVDREMSEVRKEGVMMFGAGNDSGMSHSRSDDAMEISPPSSPEPERVS